MLSLFRRGGPAQIAMGAIVFLIAISFALEFRSSGRGASGLSLASKCAVEVQGRCVPEAEFFTAAGLIIPQGLSASRQKALNINQQVLDGLVERELLLIEAARLGLSISDAEIEDELLEGRAHVSLPLGKLQMLAPQLGLGAELIRTLPVYNSATKAFDVKLYERVVRSITGRGPKEFKEVQRKELLAARVRELVRARVRVSESEAFLQFQRERSKAVVRSVQLRRDWFAKWAVDQSDAAVDAWAKEHASEVNDAWNTAKKDWTKGCLRVRELAMPFDGTDDDQKAELRRQLEASEASLAKGTPFEWEARRAGSGGGAVLGGDIGCLAESYGEGWKELAAAAEKLAPGKRSGIVETSRGFHLLQLIERVPEAKLEGTGRRFVARGLMARLRAEELARKFGEELIARAKAGAKLDDATRELVSKVVLAPKKGPGAAEPAEGWETAERPKVEVSAPFSIGGDPIPNASGASQLTLQVFELSAPEALLAEPIETSDGLAVVQLKEKNLATKEEFQKDKLPLMRQLAALKQLDALVRYVEQLKLSAKGKLKTSEELAQPPKRPGEDD